MTHNGAVSLMKTKIWDLSEVAEADSLALKGLGWFSVRICKYRLGYKHRSEKTVNSSLKITFLGPIT